MGENMSDEIDFRPTLNAEAFKYLMIQQGRINEKAESATEWEAAYRQQLLDTLAAIDRFIPRPLTSVLDIGGGMGGFDALLNSLQPGLSISILDGFDAAAEVKKRDQPYSNRKVAETFLRENGVTDLSFINPNALPAVPPKVDLILSLQAWCFHFMPDTYMKFALKASRPGTVWILDVRVMTKFWASDLFSQPRLEPIGEAPGFNDKYTRMAFRVGE